jgi:hypothetical protein
MVIGKKMCILHSMVGTKDNDGSAVSPVQDTAEEEREKVEQKQTEYRYCDMSHMTLEDYVQAANLKTEDRLKLISKCEQKEYSAKDTLAVAPMTFLEELYMMLFFLFAVPGGVFSIPFTIGIVGFLTGNMTRTLFSAALILIPLAIVPVKFNKNFVTSWYTFQFLRYFSLKFVCPTNLDPEEPHILVTFFYFLLS